MVKKKLVIVGGGTAGWLSAALLAKHMSPVSGWEIVLIESSDFAPVGVGEATIPPIVGLCPELGLSEADMLLKTEGTYKYGIHFEGWSQAGEHYMHAFGGLGTSWLTNNSSCSFAEMWFKKADAVGLKTFTEFSPAATAAYQGRFHHPALRPENASPRQYFPICELHYAYQFDAALLADYLKTHSIGWGVTHLVGTIKDVNTSASGDIDRLVLSDNTEITADFFIDCSGTKGILNRRALSCAFENWGHYLPCDKAWTMQTEKHETPLPYTKATAMRSGWCWQIPLRHRVGNGYVYSSQFCSDNDAFTEFERHLGDEKPLTEPKHLAFETGCLKEPWKNNSVAIGLSSGFMEPLESTSIHLIYQYVLKLREALLQHVTQGRELGDCAAEFNHSYVHDTLAIRDFLVLHYHANRRENSAFWHHCAHMPIPNTLQQKLDEFTRTGRIHLDSAPLFQLESWYQVLAGQRYLKSYAPFADESIDDEDAKLFFDNVKQAIHTDVQRLPEHQSYLSTPTEKQK